MNADDLILVSIDDHVVGWTIARIRSRANSH